MAEETHVVEVELAHLLGHLAQRRDGLDKIVLEGAKEGSKGGTTGMAIELILLPFLELELIAAGLGTVCSNLSSSLSISSSRPSDST